MKNALKTVLTIFFVMLFAKVGLPMPHSQVSGMQGVTIFTMMYPKDSATFKIVQMQEERIYMQLYPCFSVVKGWYMIKNTTKSTLHFKMGYPVNCI